MHYPTAHVPWQARQGWGSSETTHWMALAWATLAFFGGTMLGMMAGKKKGYMMSGMETGGTRGGMPLWKHHHHGFGQPSCHMRHEAMRTAAPGASQEKPHDRDEGE